MPEVAKIPKKKYQCLRVDEVDNGYVVSDETDYEKPLKEVADDIEEVISIVRELLGGTKGKGKKKNEEEEEPLKKTIKKKIEE